MTPNATPLGSMANDDRAAQSADVSRVASQDHASAESPTTDTRRTSTSSAGMSNETRRDAPSQASMQASMTSIPSDSARRPRPRPVDYGSVQGSVTSRSQALLSPSLRHVAKRPSASRQTSSTAPHRGQEFSIDDDPDEVDKDLRLARTHTKENIHRERQDRERQLRRRESTLRRRPTAQQPPALRTVHSEEADEDTGITTGNDATAAASPVVPPQADSNGDPGSEATLQGEEDGRSVRREEVEERVDDGDDEEDDTTPNDEVDEDDDADLSDAESFTLKDRQEAINETHPFGIRIWKPALYKKNRSVQRNAEGDIHSAPGGNVSRWLWVFNCLWTVIFGWWLALIAALGGVINLLLAVVLGLPGCYDYGRVLINLSHYLFYPFGKYVKLDRDEAYLEEDLGEGRSISEYERWQTGDLEEGRLFFGPTDINRSIIGRRRDDVEDLPDESDSLLGRPARQSSTAERAKTKKRFFGRGSWNVGRVVFFLSFYFFITPCLFLVSGICWFLVFTIPMGKVTLLLFYHLRRHPLALSFHTDSHYARIPSVPRGSAGSSVLLCTYRAVGSKYWKYTIDGTNIFLINLLGMVAFAIFDYFVLYEALGVRTWLTSPGLVFVLALASIIPLAYFIGQAVASISAQSSMGVGATINAFFSTVVEVFLYCVALKEGKAQLVEGSIIGSIFAGILFLPGLSMCFGALKRKTQRFNVKSAGVTSTMLLFAVIGAFGPTLFYQIYGSHELNCHQCFKPPNSREEDNTCRRCYFDQTPAVHSNFYIEAVRPYIWFCAICLFLSYVVGLLFTLRTHAAVIWNNEPDEKKDAKMDDAMKKFEHRQASTVPGTGGLGVHESPARPGVSRGETAGTLGSLARENIRDSQMYKRILNQSLKQAGINPSSLSKGHPVAVDDAASKGDSTQPTTPHVVPPKSADGDASSIKSITRIQGMSAEDSRALVQQVAEMAATAATVAARDATKAPRRAAVMATTVSATGSRKRNSSITGKDSHAHHDHGFLNTSEHNNTTEHPIDPNAPPGDATTKPDEHATSGGHDAPNWSRTKSAVILLVATIAYAIIAEILVDTVDVVLSSVTIDEKFLGITLFALVPNTTEFLNAISFAMNGNVALSMEIGSSYALQVMLLQIPCLVLFSAIYTEFYLRPEEWIDHTFTLIFPQWDMVTVILGVFLMGWVVGEGKSNYFKGSTLIFTYLVVTVGFWFSGYDSGDRLDTERFGTLAVRPETFRTVGWASRGRAY